MGCEKIGAIGVQGRWPFLIRTVDWNFRLVFLKSQRAAQLCTMRVHPLCRLIEELNYI